MNKKRILILLVICIILLPITVFATMNIRIVVDKVLTKEEVNEQRQIEKDNWIESQKSNIVSYSSLENENITDEELINQYKVKTSELNSDGNNIDGIINKFYEKEYKDISNKIAQNADKMSLNELYEQDYSKELFELIIDIIKNKNITNEEKSILKEFLKEQSAFIKEESEVRKEINKVVNDN